MNPPAPPRRPGRTAAIVLLFAVASPILAFVGSDLPFDVRRAFGALVALAGIVLMALRAFGRGPMRGLTRGPLVASLSGIALAVAISFLRD